MMGLRYFRMLGAVHTNEKQKHQHPVCPPKCNDDLKNNKVGKFDLTE